MNIRTNYTFHRSSITFAMAEAVSPIPECSRHHGKSIVEANNVAKAGVIVDVIDA
jgi:hypothetical protein